MNVSTGREHRKYCLQMGAAMTAGRNLPKSRSFGGFDYQPQGKPGRSRLDLALCAGPALCYLSCHPSAFKVLVFHASDQPVIIDVVIGGAAAFVNNNLIMLSQSR